MNIRQFIYTTKVKIRLKRNKNKWFKDLVKDLTDSKTPFEVNKISSLIEILFKSKHRMMEIDSPDKSIRVEYNVSICRVSDNRQLYCLTAKLIKSPNLSISSVSDIVINVGKNDDTNGMRDNDDNVVIDLSTYNPVMNSALQAVRFNINQRTYQFSGSTIEPKTYTGLLTEKAMAEIEILMKVLSDVFTIILNYGKEWMTKL